MNPIFTYSNIVVGVKTRTLLELFPTNSNTPNVVKIWLSFVNVSVILFSYVTPLKKLSLVELK